MLTPVHDITPTAIVPHSPPDASACAKIQPAAFIELVRPVRLTATDGVMVRSILSDSLTEVSADDLRRQPLMFSPAYRLEAERQAGDWEAVSPERERRCDVESLIDSWAALALIEAHR
jgi:hypothetical protein